MPGHDIDDTAPEYAPGLFVDDGIPPKIADDIAQHVVEANVFNRSTQIKSTITQFHF